MLTKSKVLKLIDFGISRNVVIAASITGSLGYRAPETLATDVYSKLPQERKAVYTNRCDIWSMGCVVFELCCGYPPLLRIHNEYFDTF